MVEHADIEAGRVSGHYRMTRGWLDHPVFGREPLCRRAAWAWLIEHAVWKPTKISIGGKLVTLQRGQLSYSIRQLAEKWHWDKAAVSRLSRRLETETMIETSTETGQLIITICNYDLYQSQSTSIETAKETATETTARQQRDSSETPKEENKEREENTPPLPPTGVVPPTKPNSVGSRLPEGWAPSAELSAWTTGKGFPAERVPLELEKFHDFWRAAAGAKGRKADWDATWRTWIRRSLADLQQTGPPDPIAAGFAASQERMRQLDETKKCQSPLPIPALN